MSIMFNEQPTDEDPKRREREAQKLRSEMKEVGERLGLLENATGVKVTKLDNSDEKLGVSRKARRLRGPSTKSRKLPQK